MTIQIDNGIPVPRRAGVGGKKTEHRLALEALQVGQSFFVCQSVGKSIRAMINAAQKQTGNRYATRTVTENGETGVRVWRIE